MKKLLALLGTLTITTNVVPTVITNRVLLTTLESNNVNLKNFEQLKIKGIKNG